MRNFISLLLVLTLSWITTGYSCRMDMQNVVHASCCCKGKHVKMAEEKSEDSQPHSLEMKRCCDVTVSSTVDQQQPAVASVSPVFDLPVLAVLPTVEWSIAAPVASLISLPPPARGPPHAGTRTYLATARLRL